ncbi:MAG TPA: DNA polymerase Y family protein [Candidatus Baltobacteraceae bacterium]|nr:DNA polymerase Y family protein [Candidatus Baltobacteraceae bacterium]
MPIVCACVPSYKAAVARRERPELQGRPLLVADRLERGHIVDLDDAAYALGARAGMTLVQAAASAREAAVVVDDLRRDRELWDEALEALDVASPLVEDAAEGVAFLEMRGIAGTPEQWLDAVRHALTPLGLPLRIALGPNPFVSRAAALVADGTIVRHGEERALLEPLPLRILDCDEATIARLRLLGIETLGSLAALPHGPFVRRFGPAASCWHAQARGQGERPLVPRRRALRIDRTRYGEGSAEREDQLLFALRSLVTQVAEDIAYVGKRCARLVLTLECEDASTHDVVTTLARPTAQAQTMLDLLRVKLEGMTLSAPVAGMRLGAERLEEGGAPLSLFTQTDPDPESIAIALARLEAALGPGHAFHARVNQDFRDEARAAYEPFNPEQIMQRTQEQTRPQDAAPFTYRILPPESIEVRVHEGMLSSVDGRSVLEYAGPWRVDERWWDQHLERDEYDVFLADGALWRIASDELGWSLLGVYD